MIDLKDKELISLLQSHARLSLSDLARRLGMARSTVQARLEKLENSGVIAGYGVRFGENYEAKRIHASLLAVIASGASSEVIAKLRKYPEIERVSTSAGRYDLIIELAVESLERIDEIIDELEGVDGFEGSETLVHLTRRLDRRI